MSPFGFRRTFRSALAFGAALLSAAAALAQATQPAALPKAEDLLKKMVDALGGEEAHGRLRNRVTTGTIEFVGSEIRGSINSKEAAPNLSFVVMQLGELGEMKQGYDGQVLWQCSQMHGPRIMEGEERDALARQAEFNAPIHWKRLYKKVETSGVDAVGTEDCYVVTLTPADGGAAERWFLSKSSGLLLRGEIVMKGALGIVNIQTDYGDYKVVDGVKLPHTLVQTAMNMKLRTIVERVEHNVKLPRTAFAPPDEVRDLLRDRDEKKDAGKPSSAPASRPK